MTKTPPQKMELHELLLRAPKGPGCYIWRDSKNRILYIGKARNLKSRLLSYLRVEPAQGRTWLLMQKASQVEWVSTLSEAEALLLESNLIKKHKPRYNVRLKDDKSYPWICISVDEPFPRVFLTRNTKNRKVRYFGPYTDVRAARSTLDLIHKIFPVRKKRQRLPAKHPQKPCLNFHIKRCLAPCQGNVPEEEYAKLIKEIILFLEGRREVLENLLRERMEGYSKAEAFERAAIYRDMLLEIRRISEEQNVRQSGMADEDVLALARKKEEGQMVVLEFRAGNLIARKSFPLSLEGFAIGQSAENTTKNNKETEKAEPKKKTKPKPLDRERAETKEIYYSFIRDYYLGEALVPKKILFDERLPALDKRLLEEALCQHADHKVVLQDKIPPKRKSVLRLALQNAEMLLSERLISSQIQDRRQALLDLREMIHLSEEPAVIECYDISHLQGTHTVASGVVFLDGAPKPSAYRRYRIRSVEGIDDPASIREVIARRLQGLLNERKSLPDLIVIDGGLTQLSAACEAARSLELGELPFISLAKRLEEVYVPGRSGPIQFDPHRPGMRLLERLRDEAHRFALTYQRQKRNRAARKSSLEDLPKIGPAKRKALLLAFPHKPVSRATIEELQSVVGIGPKLAREIHSFYRKKRDEHS